MECVFLDYDKLLNQIKRIHFIGIGGSGMCPIAEILMSEGFEISGSDMNEGETLDKMKGYGIPVYMGHAAENIKGAELVVYSAAVKENNPERQAAVAQGIPCIERSVMLGVVTRRYRRSIAIAGTHGKTTTTAMLSQLLIGSGFDPSAIIGGKLPFIGGNSYVGQSDIIVCEACEYVDTFLELNPFISVILNVDADHLDYFKNLDNIKKSFNKFAKQTTGLLVLNGDDPLTASLGLHHKNTVCARTCGSYAPHYYTFGMRFQKALKFTYSCIAALSGKRTAGYAVSDALGFVAEAVQEQPVGRCFRPQRCIRDLRPAVIITHYCRSPDHHPCSSQDAVPVHIVGLIGIVDGFALKQISGERCGRCERDHERDCK